MQTNEELAGIVAQTTPRAFIFSDDVRASVVGLQELLHGRPYDIDHYLHTEGDGTDGSAHLEATLRNSSVAPATTDNLEAEGIAALIFTGGATILMRQFVRRLVLELIERERVSIFGAVPTMYQMIAQAPNWAAADLSSLRFCTSGGAPLPARCAGPWRVPGVPGLAAGGNRPLHRPL